MKVPQKLQNWMVDASKSNSEKQLHTPAWPFCLSNNNRRQRQKHKSGVKGQEVMVRFRGQNPSESGTI